MTEKLIHIFKGFLGFLLPQRCIGCQKENTILCNTCIEAIVLSEKPEVSKFPEKSEFLDEIFSAASYKNEIIKKAIWLLKYKNAKILAEPLAEIVFRQIKNSNQDIDFDFHKENTYIIPIPLSKKRFYKRGYNQAELIGKFLSDKMSIKIISNVLYKIEETESQVEIKNKEKRLKNLSGAFETRNAKIIKDKDIILIDDVITTGATLNEVAKTLKLAGAKKIIGITVAKG